MFVGSFSHNHGSDCRTLLREGLSCGKRKRQRLRSVRRSIDWAVVEEAMSAYLPLQTPILRHAYTTKSQRSWREQRRLDETEQSLDDSEEPPLSWSTIDDFEVVETDVKDMRGSKATSTGGSKTPSSRCHHRFSSCRDRRRL